MAKKVSSKKSAAKSKKPVKSLASKAIRKPVAKAKPAAATAKPAAKPTVKSAMTKAELNEFRALLMEKRRSLIGDMNYMESEALRVNRQDGSGDLSIMPDHPANIATDNFEQEFTLGLLESERTLLSEINDALERIDAGVYGICLGTNEPISKARLKARPWAKYCIEYARMMEKGLVRPGESSSDTSSEESQPVDEDEEEVEEEPVDTEE